MMSYLSTIMKYGLNGVCWDKKNLSLDFIWVKCAKLHSKVNCIIIICRFLNNLEARFEVWWWLSTLWWTRSFPMSSNWLFPSGLSQSSSSWWWLKPSESGRAFWSSFGQFCIPTHLPCSLTLFSKEMGSISEQIGNKFWFNNFTTIPQEVKN